MNTFSVPVGSGCPELQLAKVTNKGYDNGGATNAPHKFASSCIGCGPDGVAVTAGGPMSTWAVLEAVQVDPRHTVAWKV
jgi:hypothetical protein